MSANGTTEVPAPEIDRQSPIHLFRHRNHVSKLTDSPSADHVLTLFKAALAFVDNIKNEIKTEAKDETKTDIKNDIKNDTPADLPNQLRTFLTTRSDFPPWTPFTTADQEILERLVAPRNRSGLLKEGARCECCYGRRPA